MQEPAPARGWKQRFRQELVEYSLNALYMGIFFSAIVLYRRLLLAEYGIELHDYFMGVVKALVIAKVVMIGTFMKISRRYEHKALIIPVVYKAALFTGWVMLFDLVEVAVRSLLENPGLAATWEALQAHVAPVWLSACLLIFIAFLPFFAFKEMARVMGSDTLVQLFLRDGGRGSAGG